MALEDRILIENLTWQVETLSRATRKGFRIINKQVQANTKMTLQNRLALDLLLVKEQGVCGYLKLDKEHCCIHIPNITDNLQEQLDKMRKLAEDSRAITDATENS